jgi:hypothetical protein
MKTHVLGIVEHTDRILSSVPPEKIDQIVNSLASLDAAKLNHLIETIGKLHLQIQI